MLLISSKWSQTWRPSFKEFEILAFKWFLQDGLHDNKIQCRYWVLSLLWSIHATKMSFVFNATLIY